MNTVIIREDDLIETIADALQYISYFHPMDYIRALGAAYEREVSPAAKDAMAQILSNSPMRSEERRVGKECVSTCRYRWSPSHKKKKTIITQQMLMCVNERIQ